MKDAVSRFTSHSKQSTGGGHGEVAAEVSADEFATAAGVTAPDEEETTARGDTKIEPIKDGDYKSALHPTSEEHPGHHPGPTDLGENHSSVDPARSRNVIQLDIAGKPVTIRSQIQLYATNDQLSCKYSTGYCQRPRRLKHFR